MKINFPLPNDGKRHDYCLHCHSENVHRILERGKNFFLCDDCHKKSPRLVIIDPKIIFWMDGKTKEYWHETVGVFVFNNESKALFFERVKYPFALTIPAGHLERGKTPQAMAKQELWEETGIRANRLKLFIKEDIIGDKCQGGADNHKWHLYTTKVEDTVKIKINDEGTKPIWLTFDEALQKDIVQPARYLIEKYDSKLLG